MIRIVPTNIKGDSVNETHHFARHPDTVVEQARALRAEGHTLQHIAELLGVPRRQTICDWVMLRRPKPAIRRVARRLKTPEMPRHGRGPARCAWVNTPLRMGGLPRGLHDHYFPSAKCPPDVRHIACELAFMRASPYEVNLLNQATNCLPSLRLTLIPK